MKTSSEIRFVPCCRSVRLSPGSHGFDCGFPIGVDEFMRGAGR